MKITNEHVARLLEARLARIQRVDQPPSQPPTGPRKADRATFSSLLDDLQVGLAAARSCREADDPRLTALAAQIRAGRYDVPGGEIAEAILRECPRGAGATGTPTFPRPAGDPRPAER